MKVAEIHDRVERRRSLAVRHRTDQIFVWFCLGTAFVSIVILGVLLAAILWQGLPTLNWKFVTSTPSATPSEAGIRPSLFGTIWVCGSCALFALPIGVASAIFLEEFKPHGRLARAVHGFVQLNISNLAGVPSVVYGIIGLTAFASMFGLLGTAKNPSLEIGASYSDQFITEGNRIVLVPVESSSAPETEVRPGMEALTIYREPVEVNVIGPREPLPADPDVLSYTLRNDAEPGRAGRESWYYFRLPFGRGVLAGGLTLMLVILPVVIIASQESLRAIPASLREASLGMGATTWQTVRRVTLPAAIPGIMTGSILSMSRAIGEAAPILIISGIIYIAASPGNLMDDFSVLPLQIFDWAARPQHAFHAVAAKGIIVLLTLLLSFNAVAVLIRNKTQGPPS